MNYDRFIIVRCFTARCLSLCLILQLTSVEDDDDDDDDDVDAGGKGSFYNNFNQILIVSHTHHAMIYEIEICLFPPPREVRLGSFANYLYLHASAAHSSGNHEISFSDRGARFQFIS
jgi:hypothetical protein